MNRRGMVGFGALPLLAVPIAEPRAQQRPRPASAPAAGSVAPLPGAFADGASHPLSSRFGSLAEARAVFPHAVAMTDEIDWCALQGAINAAEARGSGAVDIPNTGRAYVLNRGLVINPNRTTIHGNGSTLDFRTLPANGRGIWFKADGAAQYGHERHACEGLELVGPGPQERGPAAFFFQTETEALSSRVMLRDCTIHGFSTGLLFGHRAYCICFSHVSVYDCVFALHAPYQLQDAGESVSFSQCTFFNSRYLVSNPAGFGLKFFCCSFDYCTRVVWDNNGGIDMVGCHIETTPPTELPFHCNHGSINFFGGFILIHNPEQRPTRIAEFFGLSQPGAAIHFWGTNGWNWHTTTGRLTNGPGKVFWHAGQEINTAPAGFAR